MQIDPFGLERWFAEYEHEVDVMLAESGIRSLDAAQFDTDPGELGYVIPTNGDPDLRARIGDRYDRRADEVLCTCGTQEANFLAFLSLLDEGDHVVVVTPTYEALHAIPEALADVTRVWLEPPEWQLDPDAVADAIRPETSLVVLNNPNNPTGRYHTRETVAAVADLAADAGAYLLCDEVYRLLAENPQPPVASQWDHAISTTSVTKAWGLAGLRFGWLVGPPAVVEPAWQWKDYTTISPSIFGQHVARQALDREDELLSESRRLAREHHDRVQRFLDEHDLDWYDPVGVNGFVTVPAGFDSGTAFCRAFVEEENVLLAPGAYFGYDEFFRIGFGLPTAELEEGLARLAAFLERHHDRG